MSDNRRHPLNARASQDTLVSLLQLDPMPIVDVSPPQIDVEKDLPPTPVEKVAASSMDSTTYGANTSSVATTSALGLSGTGHSAVYYRLFLSPPVLVLGRDREHS